MRVIVRLSFEYGAVDATPLVIEGEWFQITYTEIRNDQDEPVAYYAGNLWNICDRTNGGEYSDVIISTRMVR